jgi:hypothetical protein
MRTRPTGHQINRDYFRLKSVAAARGLGAVTSKKLRQNRRHSTRVLFDALLVAKDTRRCSFKLNSGAPAACN